MFSSIPIASPTDGRDPERREAGEERRRQRGHDLERQRRRVELGDRGGEDAEPAGDDGGEHRVRQRQLVRREAEQHRADLVLRGGPRREPEAAEPEQERERERRRPRTIAGRMRRSIGTIEPKSLTVSRGSTGGCGLVAIPNASATPACATSSTPSEAASFASGEAVRSGRNATSSISTPSATRNRNVMTSAARRRRLPAVDARLERPVRVAAEHRDGTGREIDDPRAAIGQDDAEGDAGDQRAGAEPEDREEEELVPVHALRVSTKTGRGPTFGPAPRPRRRC